MFSDRFDDHSSIISFANDHPTYVPRPVNRLGMRRPSMAIGIIPPVNRVYYSFANDHPTYVPRPFNPIWGMAGNMPVDTIRPVNVYHSIANDNPYLSIPVDPIPQDCGMAGNMPVDTIRPVNPSPMTPTYVPRPVDRIPQDCSMAGNMPVDIIRPVNPSPMTPTYVPRPVDRIPKDCTMAGNMPVDTIRPVNVYHSFANDHPNNVLRPVNSIPAPQIRSMPIETIRPDNVYCDYKLSALKRFISLDAVYGAFPCFPGTRKHALETIQRWFDYPNAERILWLHGAIGTGKSAIAQTAADANRGDKVAVTFFFRSSPDCNDGNRLFPTLAWKLAFSFSAIKHHIAHSLHKRPDLPRSDVETQFEELIFRPFIALNWTQKRAPVVIIDGIDECPDENLQQRILKVIVTAVGNRNFPLRFLISSRREAHIEDMPISNIDLSSLKDTNVDINRYLCFEFARIVADQGLDPTWPSQQIIRDLVLKSAGRFSYAADVIRLVDDSDEDAPTQLDIFLKDQSYFDILDSMSDQESLTTFLELLVGHCLLSGESLRNNDVIFISRVDSRRKLQEISSNSMIKFESDTGLYHPSASFLEFLQDQSQSGQYHVSKSTGTRRYLELTMNLLIERITRLTRQPNFHEIDHFGLEFGKLMSSDPEEIELDIEDWEQMLRRLLDNLTKLLVPSKIDSVKSGYCQNCRFFQNIYDILTYFKSIRKREDAEVDKCLRSLEEIMRYGDGKRQKLKFIGRGLVVKVRNLVTKFT